eukprot:scaffold4840_cov115-Isochrysis_galbana.AAC.21
MFRRTLRFCAGKGQNLGLNKRLLLAKERRGLAHLTIRVVISTSVAVAGSLRVAQGAIVCVVFRSGAGA